MLYEEKFITELLSSNNVFEMEHIIDNTHPKNTHVLNFLLEETLKHAHVSFSLIQKLVDKGAKVRSFHSLKSATVHSSSATKLALEHIKTQLLYHFESSRTISDAHKKQVQHIILHANQYTATEIQNFSDEFLAKDINLLDYFSHLSSALSFGCHCYDTIKLLIDNGAKLGFGSTNQPLVLAIIDGNIDIVSLLIENGADLNASSVPVDCASALARTPIEAAVMKNNIELTKLLLENGSGLDSKLYFTSLLEIALENYERYSFDEQKIEMDVSLSVIDALLSRGAPLEITHLITFDEETHFDNSSVIHKIEHYEVLEVFEKYTHNFSGDDSRAYYNKRLKLLMS